LNCGGIGFYWYRKPHFLFQVSIEIEVVRAKIEYWLGVDGQFIRLKSLNGTVDICKALTSIGPPDVPRVIHPATTPAQENSMGPIVVITKRNTNVRIYVRVQRLESVIFNWPAIAVTLQGTGCYRTELDCDRATFALVESRFTEWLAKVESRFTKWLTNPSGIFDFDAELRYVKTE